MICNAGAFSFCFLFIFCQAKNGIAHFKRVALAIAQALRSCAALSTPATPTMFLPKWAKKHEAVRRAS